MKKILVIEDEEKIARVLQLELEHEGYRVTLATDGTTGLLLLGSPIAHDLILLDILLPDIFGLEVLHRIRMTNQHIPIIILTARDTIPDRVSGLDLGANDYITKPFAIEELLARIRNVFRQEQIWAYPHHDQLLQSNDLTMDLKSREVYRHEHSIELTPTEFKLLHYLIEFKNEVRTREQILGEVWGYDFLGETNIVDVYIRYLRQKIDKPFANKLIHTVRGIGYKFKDSP